MHLTWPSTEQGLSLHRRLCAGEATASSDFAVAYTNVLGAWIQTKNPRADEDQCQDAAHRAILALIHCPSCYDPARGKMAAYLRSLNVLARRVECDPFFLAGLLADYAERENIDEAGLAAALGCNPEALTALRLCRAPRPDRVGFREDVDQIAAHFGLDADRLTAVVRGRSEALRRL
jgi:hypothetical protein